MQFVAFVFLEVCHYAAMFLSCFILQCMQLFEKHMAVFDSFRFGSVSICYVVIFQCISFGSAIPEEQCSSLRLLLWIHRSGAHDQFCFVHLLLHHFLWLSAWVWWSLHDHRKECRIRRWAVLWGCFGSRDLLIALVMYFHKEVKYKNLPSGTQVARRSAGRYFGGKINKIAWHRNNTSKKNLTHARHIRWWY